MLDTSMCTFLKDTVGLRDLAMFLWKEVKNEDTVLFTATFEML